MTSKIRILIVDDHAVVRMGLKAFIRKEKDLTVVGEAESGDEAVRKVGELKPDVVLLDFMMPRMDGVEATRRILAVCPETRILIFTSYGTSEGVVRAIQAGATGAIQKDISFSKLTGVIRDVAAGRTVIAPEIRAGVAESQSIPELTERQREILESITRGLTNSDIATQLGITPDAVKGHLTRLFAKLGVSGRSEAIALAFRRQMLKM